MVKRLFWFFGVAVFLLALFLPGFTKLQELRERNVDLEGKIRRLTVENALFQEELRKIETDPLYQERMAREKMGVVRKGEIPVKMVTEESQ